MSPGLPLALGKGEWNYVTILTMIWHHAARGEVCVRPQVVREREGRGLADHRLWLGSLLTQWLSAFLHTISFKWMRHSSTNSVRKTVWFCLCSCASFASWEIIFMHASVGLWGWHPNPGNTRKKRRRKRREGKRVGKGEEEKERRRWKWGKQGRGGACTFSVQ